MSAARVTTSEATVTAPTRGGESSFPFAPGAEWLEALSKMSFYGPLFDLTAKQLRAQADFMQGLAEGGNPADLFSRQVEFIQSSVKTYSEEASKVFGPAFAALRGLRPGNSDLRPSK